MKKGKVTFQIEQNGGEYYGYCIINATECKRISDRKFLLDKKYEIEFDERADFEVKTEK